MMPNVLARRRHGWLGDPTQRRIVPRELDRGLGDVDPGRAESARREQVAKENGDTARTRTEVK